MCEAQILPAIWSSEAQISKPSLGLLAAEVRYHLGGDYLANPGTRGSNFVGGQPLLAEAVGLLFPFSTWEASTCC